CASLRPFLGGDAAEGAVCPRLGDHLEGGLADRLAGGLALEVRRDGEPAGHRGDDDQDVDHPATTSRHCALKAGNQASGWGPCSPIRRSISRTVDCRADSTATRSGLSDRSSSHTTLTGPCLSRKRRPPAAMSSLIMRNSGSVSLSPPMKS